MEPNLQKYLAFVKAVETGSFSKAAEALGYSQSGVSRMISDLEQEWGVTLLERGKGGVQLTSDGVRLLPFAEKLCGEFRALEAEVAQLRGLKTGLIRIGTFSSVAEHWLPNIIRAFQKDYPNIDYELLLGDYTEIEQWIRCGRVDCGFLSLPVSGGMDAVFLEQDELMAVIPENHPLAGCEAFPVKALEDMPFMLLEKGAKNEITDFLERSGIKPNVKFTTWDDYAIMSMVESGLGISILPSLILKRKPYKLLAKPLSVPAFRRIGFVLRERKTASVAVRTFMRYLDCRGE